MSQKTYEELVAENQKLHAENTEQIPNKAGTHRLYRNYSKRSIKTRVENLPKIVVS